MVRKIGRERQRLILPAREVAAVAESPSRSKIQLEEPDEESQLTSSTPFADGTWKTISGRAIVSSEKLLEKLDEYHGILSILPGKSPSYGKCSD